jgi:hypothetical protein
VSLGGIKLAEDVELGRGREVYYFLEVGHEVDLAAAFKRVHTLLRRLHDVAIEIGGALLEFGETDELHEQHIRWALGD